MKKQIELLKQLEFTDYSVENGKITINGNLGLNGLKELPEKALQDVSINGSLGLNGLKELREKALQDVSIYGIFWSKG